MCRSTSSGWNRSRRHHWQGPRPRAHLDFAADRRPGDRRPRSRSGEARRVLPAVARSPAHAEAGHERHRRRRGHERGRHQGEQGGAEGVRRQRLGERDGDEAGPSPRAVPRGDEAQRVEAANLLAMATEKKILAGKLNGDIDLKGGGQGLKDLSKTLAGILDGTCSTEFSTARTWWPRSPDRWRSRCPSAWPERKDRATRPALARTCLSA